MSSNSPNLPLVVFKLDAAIVDLRSARSSVTLASTALERAVRKLADVDVELHTDQSSKVLAATNEHVSAAITMAATLNTVTRQIERMGDRYRQLIERFK